MKHFIENKALRSELCENSFRNRYKQRLVSSTKHSWRLKGWDLSIFLSLLLEMLKKLEQNNFLLNNLFCILSYFITVKDIEYGDISMNLEK